MYTPAFQCPANVLLLATSGAHNGFRPRFAVRRLERWLALAQCATKVLEDSIVVMKVKHIDGYLAWPIQDARDCRHSGELMRSYGVSRQLNLNEPMATAPVNQPEVRSGGRLAGKFLSAGGAPSRLRHPGAHHQGAACDLTTLRTWRRGGRSA